MKNTGINGWIKSDYFDKQVDFSASDFCKPNYQLWVSKHYDKNADDEQSFKPAVGQLIHKASYDHPEIDVIKEFSFKFVHDMEYTIGGSIDRIAKLDNGQWQIEDLKTMGNFPATKAFKEPKEEWITQLSVYNYAMALVHKFDMAHTSIIHQYVLGYQKNSKLPEYKEYNKIEIELMRMQEVSDMIDEKIAIALGEIAPVFDCQVWACDYCSYSKSCPSSKAKEK